MEQARSHGEQRIVFTLLERAKITCLCYIFAPMARWQSGYAAACKAADLGSIPGLASIFPSE